MDCIFCRIAEKQAPAEIVYEDEATMAFMDINPVSPGHLLIVPKRHARTIYDIDEAEAAAVMRTAVRVARAIKAALGPDGLNLHQSNERAAGQAVFHLHLHLIPRWAGRPWTAPGQARAGDPMAIRETAARIRASLQA